MYTKDHISNIESKTDLISFFKGDCSSRVVSYMYMASNETDHSKSDDLNCIGANNEVSFYIHKTPSYLSNEILKGSNLSPVSINLDLIWNSKFENKPTFPRTHYSKVQKWVGHIIDIKEDTFIAELEDITTPGTLEVVEFEKSDVSPDEIKFIQIGAGFYWSIGQANINGQRAKQSILIFQKGVNFSSSDVDVIEERVQELYSGFNWDIK
jgi:hypothetical protein